MKKNDAHAVTQEEAGRTGRGIFYGWWIVLGCFVTNFINAGTSSYALTVMLIPMQDSFGVGRTVLSLAPTLRSLSSALLAPLIGPLLDRRGQARKIMVVGALISCGSLVLTGLSPSVWIFLISFGFLGGLSMLTAGNMMGSVLISKWFIKKRARAVAVASQGISMGGIIMAPILAVLEDAVGWRASWVILGALALIVLLPVALFVVKTEPEELGLRPDGDLNSKGTAQSGAHLRAAPTEVNWTRREAIRTPTFWFLNLTLGFIMLACTGVMFHVVPFLESQGLSRGLASWAIAVFSGGASFAYIAWGYMLDRFSARVTLVSSALLAALGIAMMMYTSTTFLIFTGSFIYGFGFGSGPITRMVWASYFGRKLQGSIQGVVLPFTTGASMLGPLLGGAFFDLADGYDLAFNFFIFMAIAAVLFGFLAGPPRRAGAHIA